MNRHYFVQHFEASTHIYIFVKLWVLAGRANEMLLNKHVLHKTYFFDQLTNWGGSGTAPERYPFKKITNVWYEWIQMYSTHENKWVQMYSTNNYKCTILRMYSTNENKCTVQYKWEQMYSINNYKCTIQMSTNVQYK